VIFREGRGALPGLRGTLRPIRDDLGRTHLFANQTAVNDGQPQPVPFLPGEPLELTDARGSRVEARILTVVGGTALVDYRFLRT